MNTPQFFLVLVIALSLPAAARSWTNSEGTTIEADFVSADGQTVRLRIRGKVTNYPLEKLSQADRDWIAEQSAGPEDEKKPVNQVYASDMEAFIKEIDKTYPFFDLKGIEDDWKKAKGELVAQASSASSDAAFLATVNRAIRVLRDGHMRITESKTPPERTESQYVPGISFIPGEGDTVMIFYPPSELREKLPTGTLVSQINGKDAREYLDGEADAAWKAGGWFSSPQRARFFAYRIPLAGEQGDEYTIHCLLKGREKKFELACTHEAGGWPHSYNLPEDLKQSGRSTFHAMLGSGAGYLYLRRVDSSVVPGIDEALATHTKAKGWIVDLRGNSGGGYDDSLITRIEKFPRPVAVIIDAGCVSAGETLARDFRTKAHARLFGQLTAGSSSSKYSWSFPSGIATLSLPTRSRFRADRKPIEFHGITPDEIVHPVPDDLQEGVNTCIRRAEAWLRERAGLD